MTRAGTITPGSNGARVLALLAEAPVGRHSAGMCDALRCCMRLVSSTLNRLALHGYTVAIPDPGPHCANRMRHGLPQYADAMRADIAATCRPIRRPTSAGARPAQSTSEAIEGGVRVELCKSTTDTRYTARPEDVRAGGFRAAGPGRYLDRETGLFT